MIINGASRRSVGFWTNHLKNEKTNDRASLVEIRGLAANDLHDGLLEMQEDARQTRCKNFFYQANFSPLANEHLTEEQWQHAFAVFEKHRGIPEGQSRIVYEHEKEGRVHRHVIWSRIDTEKLRAWPDGLDAKISHEAAREISEELGLHRSISPFDKDREGPRPERAPKSYEMFRGLKSGSDPRDVKAAVTALYRESENAWDLQYGLRKNGYTLVQGDRRDFCIMDPAGDVHSLARRLDGVNTKQLREFMKGFDREGLPSVDQARRKHRESLVPELQADLATIRDEITWEDALARAAIEKEKLERRFVEPVRTLGQIRVDSQRTYPDHHPEPKLVPGLNKEPNVPVTPGMFREASKEMTHEERAKLPLGMSTLLQKLWLQTKDIERHPDHLKWEFYVPFAEQLSRRGVGLAIATKDEAEQNFRENAFAEAVGTKMQVFKEGDIVAVTAPHREYRHYGELTLPMSRVYTLDQRLAEKIAVDFGGRDKLQGIAVTKDRIATRAEGITAEFAKQRWEDSTAKNRAKGQTVRGPIDKIARSADRSMHILFSGLETVSEMLESLLTPKMTPEQVYDSNQAKQGRDVAAEQASDRASYVAQRSLDQLRENELTSERERSRRGLERDR